MARIDTQNVGVDNPGIRMATVPTSATIIGVELFREIPQGYETDAGNVIPVGGMVRIRPTNVTATCGELLDGQTANAANIDTAASRFILLHNGPRGGFSQDYKGSQGTLYFNSVVRAVITDG